MDRYLTLLPPPPAVQRSNGLEVASIFLPADVLGMILEQFSFWELIVVGCNVSWACRHAAFALAAQRPPISHLCIPEARQTWMEESGWDPDDVEISCRQSFQHSSDAIDADPELPATPGGGGFPTPQRRYYATDGDSSLAIEWIAGCDSRLHQLRRDVTRAAVSSAGFRRFGCMPPPRTAACWDEHEPFVAAALTPAFEWLAHWLLWKRLCAVVVWHEELSEFGTDGARGFACKHHLNLNLRLCSTAESGDGRFDFARLHLEVCYEHITF